jgi:cell division septation protein DedD
MSDGRKPEDELGLDEEEELMTDFADLFAADEREIPAGETSADDSEDGSLDELDAFLDDFEKNLDVPDTSTADSDAVAASASPARKLTLEKEELDLDVGLDGEIFMDEVTLDEDELETELGDMDAVAELAEDDELLDIDAMLDESESSVTIGQTELPLEPPVAAAAATSAERTATMKPTTAPSRGGILPPPAAPALSRPQLIAGTVTLSLSLLLSLGALWMGWGLSSQIGTLNQNVSELQQRVLAQSRRGTIAPEAELGDQLNRLGERVNELAVIVEGPVSHLRESSQQELQALSERLDRLEQRPVQHQPVAISRKPLVHEAEPVVTTPPAPSKQGGWVINLLSVTSAGTAKEEMTRLRKLGIRADQQVVNQDGKTWYRLRVTGFDSYAGAKAYIETVEKQTGFSSAWVAKE